MSTQLKLRRGTTAQHSTFTGAEGEITVDTTKDTVVVHDGSTAGGIPLAKESGSVLYPTSVTLSSGTANGVAYLNGSKVLTTGSALTFNGTTLGVTQGNGTGVTSFSVQGGASAGDYGIISIANGGNVRGRFVADATVDALRFDTGGGANTAFTWLLGSGYSEQMRLTSTGLGIGTSSPVTKLQVSGASNPILRVTDTRNTVNLDMQPSGTIAYFGTASNHPLAFQTNSAEVMRIDSSGNLLVGTTSNNPAGTQAQFVNQWYGGAKWGASFNQTLSSSTAYTHINFSTNGTTVGSINANNSSTSYATSSDYRLKENIQPMQNALATVAQLNPVTYNWKADGSDGQGFIAHELQAVVPDCVTGEKDAVDKDGKPVYQGVDTSFLVATLTKAIQEQQELINQLTTRVAQLEGN